MNPGNDESGLFRPRRRRVALPSQHSRARRLLIPVAVGAVLVSAVTGILHRQMWQGASTDATRLLPASTQLYARAAAPWRTLRRTLQLDSWARTGELETRVDSAGLVGATSELRLLGVPVPIWRGILTLVDDLQVAVVPTAEGRAVAAFLQVDDPRTRARVLGLLGPYIETVDRQLGYTVQALRGSADMTPWGSSEPALVVEMTPFVVLTLGPAAAMTDLLQAKVSARSQPIRARAAFLPEGTRQVGDRMWVHADAGAVYDNLGGRQLDDAPLRAMVVERLQAVDLAFELHDIRESARIRALFASESRPWAARLGAVLGRSAHPLLEIAPADMDAAVSFAVGRSAEAAPTLTGLLTELADELERPPLRRLAQVELPLGLSLATGLLESLTGEALLLGLPTEGPGRLGIAGRWRSWALLVRSSAPAVTGRELETLLRALFGGTHAYGIVHEDGDALHIIRPPAAVDLEDHPPETLVWRVRGEVVEIAPSRAILRRLAAARREGATLGGSGASTRARRGLPLQTTALVLARPSVIDHPLAALATPYLRPDAFVAAGFSLSPDAFELHGGVGVWTLLAALLGTDRESLDALTMADLGEPCVKALTAMCRRLPSSPPCRALQPGRHELVARACRDVFGD